MPVLKTYECTDCGGQVDRSVPIEASDMVVHCDVCSRDTSFFVVMNTRGFHYNFLSGWTEDRISKNVQVTGVNATIGGVDGPQCKNAKGEILAEKFNDSERRAERRAKQKFARDKQKGRGKIYVGAQ